MAPPKGAPAAETGPSVGTVNAQGAIIPDDGTAGTTVEVDDQHGESDSAYGDELASYTTSLRSSVYEFRQENGRSYHSFRDGRYMLPNDELENDRLDIHHELILTTMHRKLFLAPIPKDITKAIDLGTGTGIWVLDFADEFPECQVKGVDLSPVQPTYVPPNAQFYVDDIEDDWGYDNDPFDFVHGRFLAGAILSWPKLVQQAYQNLKPGGWVEFQDWDTRIYSTDNSIDKDDDLNKYHIYTCGALEENGYDMSPGPKLEKLVKDAGFTNVHVQKYLMPLGTWPKDEHFKRVGAFNHLQFEQALEAIALATLTRGGAWSAEEVQIMTAKTKARMKDPKLHGQYDFYAVYGQKPETK